jgi:cation transport ATPase
VDTVIFDKTGTLTLGRPEVTACRMLDARYTLRQVGGRRRLGGL